MFVHFAESIWELSRLNQLVPELDFESRRVLDGALVEGKGGVVISGMSANWKVLGQVIAAPAIPSRSSPFTTRV
jgi:hypothetical protein